MGIYERMEESLGKSAAGAVKGAIDEALRYNRPSLTDFMGVDDCGAVKAILAESQDVICRTYGGYRGAGRARLAVAPVGFDWEGFEPEVGFFCVRCADAAPDEMTAYLKASGVKEDELGDIFRSQLDICGVAASKAVTRLASRGIDVRGFPHQVIEADPYEIALPGQQAKAIRATVSSMRLDSVAACGFPASRTRLAAEIELGRAKLNGKVTADPSARVKQGDVIVMRGRGRLVVDEEGPVTKKGRLMLGISKYSAL